MQLQAGDSLQNAGHAAHTACSQAGITATFWPSWWLARPPDRPAHVPHPAAPPVLLQRSRARGCSRCAAPAVLCCPARGLAVCSQCMPALCTAPTLPALAAVIKASACPRLYAGPGLAEQHAQDKAAIGPSRHRGSCWRAGKLTCRHQLYGCLAVPAWVPAALLLLPSFFPFIAPSTWFDPALDSDPSVVAVTAQLTSRCACKTQWTYGRVGRKLGGGWVVCRQAQLERVGGAGMRAAGEACAAAGKSMHSGSVCWSNHGWEVR